MPDVLLPCVPLTAGTGIPSSHQPGSGWTFDLKNTIHTHSEGQSLPTKTYNLKEAQSYQRGGVWGGLGVLFACEK